MAGRDGTEGALVVAAAEQDREELRVQLWVRDLVDRELVRHQRAVHDVGHDGDAALPQVDGGKDDVPGAGAEPLRRAVLEVHA